MIVHGGPEAHYSNGWITRYGSPGQVLAGRGFAVFYPNYRGSTGRGVAFSKLGQSDAAGREYDDLIDAVDHLVASGIADGDRVRIHNDRGEIVMPCRVTPRASAKAINSLSCLCVK